MTDADDLLQKVSKLPAEKRQRLLSRLQGQLAKAPSPETAVCRASPGRPPLLSYAQERLWFIDQLSPGNPIYNIPLVRRLRGRLDIGALERSLREIVRRHEILRTTFRQEGETPVQVIAPAFQPEFEVLDVRARPSEEGEAQVKRAIQEEAGRALDLQVGPLFRARLVRVTDEENILILTMHHIVSDGWSLRVLERELESVYAAYREGRESPLPELPIQYVDYAVWQREWLRGEVLEEQLRYWQGQLAGMETLELPTDRPRPAVFSGRGHVVQQALPAELARALREQSRREGVTLFMTLLAGFMALLHRYTGQEDIAVGIAVANRNRAEVHPLIGFFVNMLVLRAQVQGDLSFRELLRRAQGVTLDAQTHQDLPFVRLVDALRPPRDLSRTPLFQIGFSLDYVAPTLNLPELTVESMDVDNGTAKFDLSLAVVEYQDNLVVAIEYNTDLFDRDRIERMVGHYERLLEGAMADPDMSVGKLPLLGDAEWQQMIEGWNQTARPYPQRCIHELFDDQVARTPEAIAVVYAGRTLTYRELAERANRLGHYLRGLGVGPEQLVGICVDRSLEMIVGVLGVLKAGGAYVPLDSTYPKDRLAFMLEDTQVRVLLTQQHLQQVLPAYPGPVISLDSDWERIECESAAPPISGAEPDNLAYVIYTSGSTGKPKGVLIEHGSVSNFIASVQDLFEMGARDRVLQFASLNFDVSVFEIFSALLSGARLILADRETLLTPSALTQLMQTEAVTVTDLPPTVMALLPAEVFSALRIVFVGGEAFSGDLVNRWAIGQRRFFNGYGPTESTVTMTVMECTGEWEHTPPIGRPMANHQTYILDKNLNPVPIGVAGELHIAGVGLARGYLNRPELTQEKFILNPFGPGRLYKTGDLCRYLPDGNIDFLGRVDHQVKLRGLRIELGEVEAVLEQHPAVRQAMVDIREDVPGDKRLVAYLVSGGERPTVSGLREHLGRQLPGYMIPAAYVFLEQFPLTTSGKVDRRALPAPEASRPELDESFAAPRTHTEESLAKIFAEVLGLKQVGIHDNFFELGGNSLQVTQLVSRARATFQVELSLRAIFQTPTIADLAGIVGAARPDGAAEEERLSQLTEIEQLSEEEVEQLLERETQKN